MKKLKINLEHCYGIKKIDTEFDFESSGNVFALYAPNGSMKTSLAKTFSDISKNQESSDRIWPENKTIREIADENGHELKPESVFVVVPYNEGYRSDRISTLLANDELRKEYEGIHKEIDEKIEALIKHIEKFSGLKSDVEEEIARSITHDPKEFFVALERVRNEIITGIENPLGDVTYIDIFNPKVLPVLSEQGFAEKIKKYILKYDELLQKSTFFKRGVFTHNNASEIAKNLQSNGFFRAGHSVYLRIKGKKVEVSSLNDLEDAIRAEKNAILTDDELKKAFEEIDKRLMKNADLRKFRKCLEENQGVLVELSDTNRLRQRLWVQYLIRSKTSYLDLLTTYDESKDKLAGILEKARSQRTEWEDVINMFNERFSVPFLLRIDNQEDVILRRDTPVIQFDFLEDPDDKNSESIPVQETDLKLVLSNGEQRALYILNIIFEVEARKKANQLTLFVIDDIADSFDYKNKYAIIEYLNEIGEVPYFQQIILSHNFDFYRTVSGRLHLDRKNRLLANKEDGKIVLREEFYQNSPFTDWRRHLDNEEKLVASIPFIRNLAEFSGNGELFKQLTNLLHIKPDTNNIKINGLSSLIRAILHDQSDLRADNPNELVKDLVYRVASKISDSTSESVSLESKVALSIAIRLKAEEFMIKKINDDAFWHNIQSNQTVELMKRFKQDFPKETDSIQILEQVNLMTPENIHINSFMYEPILDMAAEHLRKLFHKVNCL